VNVGTSISKKPVALGSIYSVQLC